MAHHLAKVLNDYLRRTQKTSQIKGSPDYEALFSYLAFNFNFEETAFSWPAAGSARCTSKNLSLSTVSSKVPFPAISNQKSTNSTVNHRLDNEVNDDWDLVDLAGVASSCRRTDWSKVHPVRNGSTSRGRWRPLAAEVNSPGWGDYRTHKKVPIVCWMAAHPFLEAVGSLSIPRRV